MSRKLRDDMIDARLMAYLDRRAEDGAARARTPEQLAAEIALHLRPKLGAGSGSSHVLRMVWLLAVLALVIALSSALFAGGRLRSLAPTRVVRIAIDLPLGGNELVGAPIVNGIMLAVNDAAGQTDRFRIEIPESSIFSDLVGGLPDGSRGAQNMRQIIADPDVVAVIGPFHSSVAWQQIPISTAAGLLQCSPANTDPALTQSANGAVPPVASQPPVRSSYIRVVTTDDVAARAAARYVLERLGKTSVYVLGDSQGNGTIMADWFEAEFVRLGGAVMARASLPDSSAVLSAMLADVRAKKPQAIYFGGTGDRGAVLVRAAAQAGLGDVPLIGTDALNDGNAATPGSFLSLVGGGAQQTYSVFPGSAGSPAQSGFAAEYRARYGAEPTPFAAAGYACAQVVIAALGRVDADAAASGTRLRDAVRSAGVNPGTTFETVLGPITFDGRGDVTPGRVTIYARGAQGSDWAYLDQITATALSK